MDATDAEDSSHPTPHLESPAPPHPPRAAFRPPVPLTAAPPIARGQEGHRAVLG